MWAREAAWCVLVGLGVGAACVQASAFECASADDCIDAGVRGVCEATGFCSFPDDGCLSHQRYGDHAGDDLGGLCVPPEDATTGLADTGDDPSTTTTSSSTSLDPIDDTTPLTDASDSSGAASLGEAGSTSEVTTDPSTDSGTSTDTGTTGGVDVQCPTFLDDFEDGVIDASWSLMDGAYVTEAGGELTFELTPENDAVFPGVILPDQALASGYVRVHVGQWPSADTERLYLAVAVDPEFSDVIYIMIEGMTLTAMHEVLGVFSPYTEVAYDPMIHQWLQIRGDDDGVVFETSVDGVTFEALDNVAAPFPLVGTSVVVAGTNFAVQSETGFVSVADFEICTGD